MFRGLRDLVPFVRSCHRRVCSRLVREIMLTPTESVSCSLRFSLWNDASSVLDDSSELRYLQEAVYGPAHSGPVERRVAVCRRSVRAD